MTSFFRDPESFERLKKVVFPRILQGRHANETIRVWVAGCATGEEAYSIAISLQEYLGETERRTFRCRSLPPISAWRRLKKPAAAGTSITSRRTLPRNASTAVSRKIEGGYQINKNLREMCVFTRHNLIDDPPFSRLDLISCRNVLIYLGGVQKNIISLFHYALKPDGFLLLGAAEGAAGGDLFSEVDGAHRIYAKREGARKPHLFPLRVNGLGQGTPAGGAAQAPPAAQSWDRVDVRKQVDRVLSKYSPAALVVDENLEVLEIRGKTSPYLKLPVGKMSCNLVKLIPDTGLFLQVEELIQQARKSGETARHERVPSEHSGAPGA